MAENEPVQVARGFFEAITGGDIEGALNLLDPDVRWSRPPDVPITGTLEGIAAVRKMWTAFAGSLQSFEIEPTGLDEHGDQVLARVTMRGVAPDGGGSFEFSGAQVFRISGGEVTEVLEFRSLSEAQAALD